MAAFPDSLSPQDLHDAVFLAAKLYGDRLEGFGGASPKELQAIVNRCNVVAAAYAAARDKAVQGLVAMGDPAAELSIRLEAVAARLTADLAVNAQLRYRGLMVSAGAAGAAPAVHPHWEAIKEMQQAVRATRDASADEMLRLVTGFIEQLEALP